MSDNVGLGFCTLGFGIVGFGNPAVASGIVSNLLIDANGANVNRDAANIDIKTKDYTFDPNGNVQGMSSVTQQVYLAIMTSLNSSAVAGLGSQLGAIKLVDNKINQNITNYVSQALASLIKTKVIVLLKVNVNVVAPGAVSLMVTYFDNTSQVQNTLTF